MQDWIFQQTLLLRKLCLAIVPCYVERVCKMKLHIRAKLGLSPSMTARLPMLFQEYADDLQNVQVNMVGSKNSAYQYYFISVWNHDNGYYIFKFFSRCSTTSLEHVVSVFEQLLEKRRKKTSKEKNAILWYQWSDRYMQWKFWRMWVSL